MPDKTKALREYAAAKYGSDFARVWTDPICCEGCNDGVLLLRKPNKWFPDHFDNNHGQQFRDVAQAVFPDLDH